MSCVSAHGWVEWEAGSGARRGRGECGGQRKREEGGGFRLGSWGAGERPCGRSGLRAWPGKIDRMSNGQVSWENILEKGDGPLTQPLLAPCSKWWPPAQRPPGTEITGVRGAPFLLVGSCVFRGAPSQPVSSHPPHPQFQPLVTLQEPVPRVARSLCFSEEAGDLDYYVK